MIHFSGASCSGCEEKAATAHPYLIGWFRRVKLKYINAHIAWAFRNQAEQNQAVVDGKSRKPWPFSDHNHMVDGKPRSLALDLFQIDEDGVARWAPGFFYQLNQDNLAAGEPLFWGGRWKALGDKDHYSLDPARSSLWQPVSVP